MQDVLWLLIAACFVFLMQAGFLCLESGRTRSKNNINVAAKNMIDFLISVSIFWIFGFGLMFGVSVSGLIGSSLFTFGEQQSSFNISFFLFQMMFCGTAATLTSGAVAERMSFFGYIGVTIILCAMVYPVVGHWVWGGLLLSDNKGWLEAQGFVDFAGSTVVHSVGGWVAFMAVLIIGPRIDRYNTHQIFPSGSNLPVAALGVFLIWFGWFGFNGGSTLAWNDQVPLILLNTCLSAVWGGMAVALLHYIQSKYIDINDCMNGVIAGLVGITASCHAVQVIEAAFIGAVSGVVMYFGTILLARFNIDDALSVVPAHLMAGVWGTLAVALFGNPETLATGLSFSEQLWVQCYGIFSVGLYCAVVSYLMIRLFNYFVPLRVSEEDERLGLNITEHRASTELIQLLSEMEVQQNRGDFTSHVIEEPFTEVGQIAGKYNQVISRVNQEITKRDSAIHQFKTSEKRKSAILASAMDSIVSIDQNGLIIEFNPAAEKNLNSLKKYVLGKNFIDLFVLKKDRQVISESLKYSFSSGNGLVLNRRNALKVQRVSGEAFPAEITITSARLSDSDQLEYTLHIRNIEKESKMQSRLNYLAYSDPLTGLSNRVGMMRMLNQLMSKAKSDANNVALFFIDLDKFKKINDTLGHKAGDVLLCEVAGRLRSLSRSSDVIARWGGDEFVYVISGKFSEDVVREKASNIVDIMRVAVEIESSFYNVPASVGVAISYLGECEVDVLIQHADIAMYRAKELGRDNYQLYDVDMGEKAAGLLTIENQIREAIIHNDFVMAYQPKVKSTADNIEGFEALIRWQHPEKGIMMPGEFIPLAEESRLIIELGEYVVKAVLSQLQAWKKQKYALAPIAINISGRQLVSEGFVAFLSEQLTAFNVEGKFLEIEITEGVLIDDVERCIEVLSQLKSLGVRISIDDFGIGYSSLNYLRRLPLDVLKIDRSFVNECDVIGEDREICAAIVNLANSMNLDVIAEGVETESQRQVLIALDCHYFQGYYFHKPLWADEITALLQRKNNVVAD